MEALCVLVIVLPIYALFWIIQFVQLMLLEDKFFPGRFDKVIWGAVFVIIPPLAPIAFRVWKSARRAESLA